MQYFLGSLLEVFKKSFTEYYGLPHLVAIVGTYFFVVSDFDWYYFIQMRSLNAFTYLFFPAIVLGGILPILLPLVFLVYGYIFKKDTITIIGWTLAQAMILGSFISSFYKAFTGRIQPNLHNLTTNISHHFNFGFYEHGIFWGWPSSHTTIAFAMAVAIIKLFPNHKKVHIAVLVYAGYVGVGISFSIHWFSEFFAGILIGSAIGAVVGINFRKYYLDKENRAIL